MVLLNRSPIPLEWSLEGGNFLVQMMSTCLPSRRGRGWGPAPCGSSTPLPSSHFLRVKISYHCHPPGTIRQQDGLFSLFCAKINVFYILICVFRTCFENFASLVKPGGLFIIDHRQDQHRVRISPTVMWFRYDCFGCGSGSDFLDYFGPRSGSESGSCFRSCLLSFPFNFTQPLFRKYKI